MFLVFGSRFGIPVFEEEEEEDGGGIGDSRRGEIGRIRYVKCVKNQICHLCENCSPFVAMNGSLCQVRVVMALMRDNQVCVMCKEPILPLLSKSFSICGNEWFIMSGSRADGADAGEVGQEKTTSESRNKKSAAADKGKSSKCNSISKCVSMSDKFQFLGCHN